MKSYGEFPSIVNNIRRTHDNPLAGMALERLDFLLGDDVAQGNATSTQDSEVPALRQRAEVVVDHRPERRSHTAFRSSGPRAARDFRNRSAEGKLIAMIAAVVTKRKSKRATVGVGDTGLRATNTRGTPTWFYGTSLVKTAQLRDLNGRGSNATLGVRAKSTIISRSDSAGIANQNPTWNHADSGHLEQRI